jgi:hypothetical protein
MTRPVSTRLIRPTWPRDPACMHPSDTMSTGAPGPLQSMDTLEGRWKAEPESPVLRKRRQRNPKSWYLSMRSPPPNLYRHKSRRVPPSRINGSNFPKASCISISPSIPLPIRPRTTPYISRAWTPPTARSTPCRTTRCRATASISGGKLRPVDLRRHRGMNRRKSLGPSHEWITLPLKVNGKPGIPASPIPGKTRYGGTHRSNGRSEAAGGASSEARGSLPCPPVRYAGAVREVSGHHDPQAPQVRCRHPC